LTNVDQHAHRPSQTSGSPDLMGGVGSPWVIIGFPWISINIAFIVSFNKLDSAQYCAIINVIFRTI
jgi:hypothetical protein